MGELEHSAADIQKQMGEKEARINNIVTMTDELIKRDIADGQPEDSLHFYASATYREAHDDDRIGILFFTKEPGIDPNSFLEITYNEHGFGEHARRLTKLTSLLAQMTGTSLYLTTSPQTALTL